LKWSDLARKYGNKAKTDDCFSKISKSTSPIRHLGLILDLYKRSRSIEEGSDNGKPDAGNLPSFFEALGRSVSFAQNTFTNGPS